MIRQHIGGRRPNVHVDMLVRSLGSKRRADEDVINSLGVHVERVRVALSRRRVEHLVQLAEPRDIGEGQEGLDKGELVEVSCSNDRCGRVDCEDLGDEALFSVSIRFWAGAL